MVRLGFFGFRRLATYAICGIFLLFAAIGFFELIDRPLSASAVGRLVVALTVLTSLAAFLLFTSKDMDRDPACAIPKVPVRAVFVSFLIYFPSVAVLVAAIWNCEAIGRFTSENLPVLFFAAILLGQLLFAIGHLRKAIRKGQELGIFPPKPRTKFAIVRRTAGGDKLVD